MDTDFSTALLDLKKGNVVRRVSWTLGNPTHLEMYGPLHGPVPTENKIMAHHEAQGVWIEWSPLVADICAEDWEVVSQK